MYDDHLAGTGIEIVRPTTDEQAFVHEHYLSELVVGRFLDATRERLVRIIGRMRDDDGIDGLILGGTELALILTEPSYAGVPILDTARLHARAAVDRLLEP